MEAIKIVEETDLMVDYVLGRLTEEEADAVDLLAEIEENPFLNSVLNVLVDEYFLGKIKTENDIKEKVKSIQIRLNTLGLINLPTA